MSQTTSVACPTCGTLNDILVPGDSFDEQMKYAALQFACRECGGELPQPGKPDADAPSTD